ncbi:type II toxin-antitoxin system RelE/ParE family toxin [Chryseolinea sp. H1M3-3]|uniref:type II toxin-antitoxin system RelE/ParE family toxin n=1 Tax=Chryseolinea sp. H1M3-3 TaxID=3034144 RepID=UPI0023ED8AC2|nr:type II toxin-antitoxin system RelE/ParE family toxin [Chryseolinea sp. H1M3-3]
MQSGYKLFWSDRALDDLQNILNYLSEKWTQKDIRNFVRRLDRRLELISGNPRLFPKTTKRKNIRRSVLTKHTVIYYDMKENSVTVVTIFDPRQHPKKLKL